MSNRDNHTTIRVRNEVADKLRRIQQGSSLTLSDIISNCISSIEGTIENDTENISREQIAYDLQYHDAKESFVRNVSFRECRDASVGDVFTANTNISADEYSNETAEVIFKDKDSCILRLTQIVVENDSELRMQNIIHVSLF